MRSDARRRGCTRMACLWEKLWGVLLICRVAVAFRSSHVLPIGALSSIRRRPCRGCLATHAARASQTVPEPNAKTFALAVRERWSCRKLYLRMSTIGRDLARPIFRAFSETAYSLAPGASVPRPGPWRSAIPSSSSWPRWRRGPSGNFSNQAAAIAGSRNAH